MRPLPAQILNEFLRQLLEDQQAEAVGTVEHYQALFPGYDDGIAEQYVRHCADQAGPAETPQRSEQGASAVSPEPALAETEEWFGHYRTLEILGSGGQGVVYLAEDTELDRQVALKALHWTGSGVGEALKRFHREAVLTSLLDHPAICKVYEVGNSPRPFIVMQYAEGETLAERLRTWTQEEQKTRRADAERTQKRHPRPVTKTRIRAPRCPPPGSPKSSGTSRPWPRAFTRPMRRGSFIAT